MIDSICGEHIIPPPPRWDGHILWPTFVTDLIANGIEATAQL